MTFDDIQAAWLRYMHRADLVSDIPTVTEFALATINGRLFSSQTQVEMVQYGPNVLFQAGMLYLHQLAQDDDGLNRVAALFGTACDDYAIKLSLRLHPQAASTYSTGG